MSSEDEIELKDLISQTLEANGCLPKIKAQLRSSLYLSLHEDLKVSNLKPLINKKVKEYLDSSDGRIMFSIVREFLEFCALDFTLSVYESESYLEQNYTNRSKLIEDLGIDADYSSGPVLLQIVQRFLKNRTKTPAGLVKTLSETLENSEITSNSVEGNESAAGDKIVEGKLNSTFIVNTENNNEKRKVFENIVDNTIKNNEIITNDDTSSFVDEEVSKSNNTDLDECDTDTSLKTSDKSKLSQKAEKVKPKSVFSCLPDLSPLQNKSRVSDILPSLYSKELKDKSNLQELDKMFDMEVDYEEDFICSGQDFSESYITSDISKNVDLENDDTTDTNNRRLDNELINENCKEVITNKEILEET